MYVCMKSGVSSSQCYGLVRGMLLWHFLVIFTRILTVQKSHMVLKMLTKINSHTSYNFLAHRIGISKILP